LTVESEAFGVDVPEDGDEADITEAPLFERTHAPRTSGLGPGLLRSTVENDFDRALLAGLAFEIPTTLETS
jgi:hypothetical protein